MTEVPPPIIMTSPVESHPARRHKCGYITIAVIEVLTAVTVIIIGAVSLQKAQVQMHDIVEGAVNGQMEQDLNKLNDLTLNNNINEGMPVESTNDVQNIVDNSKYLKTGIDAYTNILLAIGIGNGVWFLIVASMAVAAASCPNNCNVVAGMVLCIFSAIGTPIQGFLLIGSLFTLQVTEGDQAEELSKILHIIAIVCSFTMFVTAIIHSALCCANSCCKPKHGATVITQHTIPMQQGQGYPPHMTPYYDNPGNAYVPEYVDDRMNRKLIEN